MNVNPQKIDKLFHDILNIINEIKDIDEECRKQNCPLRTSRIHKLLEDIQSELAMLRGKILDSIEEE